LRYESTTD